VPSILNDAVVAHILAVHTQRTWPPGDRHSTARCTLQPVWRTAVVF